MILLLFRGKSPFDRKRRVGPEVSANPEATAGQTSTARVEDLKDLPPAEA